MARPAAEEMTALLNVDALRVTYGGVTAVDDVDLDVPEGKVVGLIGPNGAGKTSIIDALTGYHAPAAGTRHLRRRRTSPRCARTCARAAASCAPSSPSSCSTTSRSRRTCSSPASGWACCRRCATCCCRSARTRATTSTGRSTSAASPTSPIACRPSSRTAGASSSASPARSPSGPRLVLMDEPAAGLDTDESVELGRHLRALPGRGRDRPARRPRHGARARRLRRDRRARLRPGHRARHAGARSATTRPCIAAYLGSHDEEAHA